MADEAAYRVDMLLPKADYRQWTVTVPWRIRFAMARDYRNITAVLRIVMRCLFTYQRKMARRVGHGEGKPAAVTFVHRAGRVLNSHPHLHSLLPDGVFVDKGGDVLRFVPLEPTPDDDIAGLVKRIAKRVTVWWDKQEGETDGFSDAINTHVWLATYVEFYKNRMMANLD